MELIKQIKQAEAKAQEIIDQARADAAAQAEQAGAGRLEALEKAEQERKKATDAAIAAGEAEGLAEVEKLKAQAEQDRRQLRDKANTRMPAAVTKVMEYISKPSP